MSKALNGLSLPQTNSGILSLPQLKDDTRYQGVPKRYENSKTCSVQNYAHTYIINLGDKYRKSTLELFESEKNEAIRQAEETLWERAEALRQETLEKALNNAKKAHDRELSKLERQWNKRLKEELLKQEQELKMHHQMEKDELEEACNIRVRDAVTETARRCEEMRQELVDAACQEERRKAIKESRELVSSYKEKYEALERQYKEEKEQALELLQLRLDKDREHAVHCAQHVERVVAQENIAKQQAKHDQTVALLNVKIEEMTLQVINMEGEIERMLKRKRNVEKEVIRTRGTFQHFIESVAPYEPGPGDFVMPPLGVERTESLYQFELETNRRSNYAIPEVPLRPITE